MIRPPAGIAADRLVVEDRLEPGVVAAERFEVRVVSEARVDQILVRDPVIDSEAVGFLLERPHRDADEVVAQQRIDLSEASELS